MMGPVSCDELQCVLVGSTLSLLFPIYNHLPFLTAFSANFKLQIYMQRYLPIRDFLSSCHRIIQLHLHIFFPLMISSNDFTYVTEPCPLTDTGGLIEIIYVKHQQC